MTKKKARRIAVYLRVSTSQQQFDLQKNAVEQWLQNCDEPIAHVKRFTEKISGRGKTRPAFDQMLEECDQGKFDTVLCYAIDRLGRTSIDVIRTILDLDKTKVRCVFIQQPFLNVSPENPESLLILAGLSYAAQIEAEMNSARTKDALAAAKEKGRPVGKKRLIKDEMEEVILRCFQRGWEIQRIVKKYNISERTLYRFKKQMRDEKRLTA